MEAPHKRALCEQLRRKLGWLVHDNPEAIYFRKLIAQMEKEDQVLKIYKASFSGCEKNAIGIHYPITTYITANDPKMAELHLYELYEHMHQLHLEEVPAELSDQRHVVATLANNIGKMSNRRGAPRLDATSDKDTLVRWLYWCDGNGSWGEEEPMTAEDAWLEVYKMVSED